MNEDRVVDKASIPERTNPKSPVAFENAFESSDSGDLKSRRRYATPQGNEMNPARVIRPGNVWTLAGDSDKKNTEEAIITPNRKQSGIPLFQGQDCAFISRMKRIVPLRDANNKKPMAIPGEMPVIPFQARNGRIAPKTEGSEISRSQKKIYK